MGFLFQMLTGRFKPHSRVERSLATEEGDVRIDVYDPGTGNVNEEQASVGSWPLKPALDSKKVGSFSRKPHKGIILTINGLAPLGNRDPRFERLNKAMAGAGYRVISPFMQDLCDFRIGVQNIRQIRTLIEAVQNDAELCPSGRLSIFAPSFAGTISLIAAADPAVHDRIDAICALGSFASAPNVIEKLFVDTDVDEYGRLILLYNYLYLSLGRNPELERALQLAIQDSYFHYNEPALPAHLATMSPENLRLFDSIRSNEAVRRFHWNVIEKRGKQKGHSPDAISAAQASVIQNLKASVALIHGQDDRVVPASESRTLHRLLKNAGKESRLTITPLISHGDQTSPLKSLHHIPGLLAGFGFFFKKAAVR